VAVVHHPDYVSAAVGSLIDPNRAAKILAFLRREHLVHRRQVIRSHHASLGHVLRVHSAEYVKSLEDPTAVGRIMGAELGAKEAQQALDLMRLMVGGTIRAAGAALRTGRLAAHLGGGFHHAEPEEGMGFCIFNDVAIAIARLRVRRYQEPILVIDLDLHDGNGTRVAFAEDPTVYTYSVHNVHWSVGDAVASTAIALGSEVDDGTFLETLRRTLPPIVRDHRPGLVFYLAGVDVARSDALGDWALTAEGILERDRFVVELVRQTAHQTPIVMLLAGGYGTSAWRYTARTLGQLVTGGIIEPPDEGDLVLDRFRRISRVWKLEPPADRDDNDWGLTEEDLLGLVTKTETMFLSAFSRHAVELQLEELGILDRIRARGFRHPHLTLDATRGLGQVLRIYGDVDRADLLVELKAGRSRSAVPGFEVLEVNWLRLQNPRAEFSGSRPQLPGQQHPGLGILREIAGWLVVMTETLRLDGIAFMPAQYYMAAVGSHHLKFLDPAVQGRFDALRLAVRQLGVARANIAVDAGAVLDERAGAPVRWDPSVTVLPVSERLRQVVTSPEYTETAHRSQSAASFRLDESALAQPPTPVTPPTEPTPPCPADSARRGGPRGRLRRGSTAPGG
jgi:acetoin utilization deacetylase AcuC-like enzyme